MDDALQRYLDEISALLSLVVCGLFACGLPSQFQEAGWLEGIGVGGIVLTAVVAYQRDLLDGTGDTASTG